MDTLPQRYGWRVGDIVPQDAFGYSPDVMGGPLKWWDGSAWTLKPLKWWDGSNFWIKPLKWWDGTYWQYCNQLSLSGTLAGGTVSSSYDQALTVGGPSYTTPITWDISTGSLPAGLSINSSTGHITGTPTTATSYTFTVRATDSRAGTAQVATKAQTVTIAAASGIALVGTLSSFNGRGYQTVTLNAPAGLAADDLFVFAHNIDATNATAAVTSPSLTLTTIDSTTVASPDGEALLAQYYKSAGSETDFHYYLNASSSTVDALLTFRGCSTTAPINAHATNSNSSSNSSPYTVTAPTITTSVANCYDVIIVCADSVTASPGNTYTAPVGWTELAVIDGASGNYSNIYIIGRSLPSAGATGTQAITANSPGNAGWLVIRFALAPP